MSAANQPRRRIRVRPYAEASEPIGEGAPPDPAARVPRTSSDCDLGAPIPHLAASAPLVGGAIADAADCDNDIDAPAAAPLDHASPDQAPPPSRSYEVGYGKPPKASRFKPGQSGNPRGRRRGARNKRTILKELLREPMTYTEHGKRKTAPADELIWRQLRNKALKGEDRAMDRLFKEVEALEREADAATGVAPAEGPMPEDDKAILARFIARETEAALQNPSETSAPTDDAAPNETEENDK